MLMIKMRKSYNLFQMNISSVHLIDLSSKTIFSELIRNLKKNLIIICIQKASCSLSILRVMFELGSITYRKRIASSNLKCNQIKINANNCNGNCRDLIFFNLIESSVYLKLRCYWFLHFVLKIEVCYYLHQFGWYTFYMSRC